MVLIASFSELCILFTFTSFFDEIHESKENCPKLGAAFCCVTSGAILFITKTSPYNEDPLTPHFYKVKLGFTGYTFFSYFCSKT